MINFLKDYSYAIYLSAWCVLTKVSIFEWKYWSVVIPVIFLIEWKAMK